MTNKEIEMPPLPEEDTENATVADQVEEPKEEAIADDQAVAHTESNDNQNKSVDKQALNFKRLREENELLKRQQLEVLQRVKQYEQSANEKEEDLEINIGDDDLFEGKHYRKLQKQLAKQQEELKNYQSQINITTTEARLKSQYSDFDKVVSVENIERLKQTEPELAATIAATSDVYSKAVSAYKMIKNLGIYSEDNYQPDRNMAQLNSLKPRPAASVSPQSGSSPLTKANAFSNGLTEDLKKQLWKEMQEAAE